MYRCENRSENWCKFRCQDFAIGIFVYKGSNKCKVIRIIMSKAIVF